MKLGSKDQKTKESISLGSTVFSTRELVRKKYMNIVLNQWSKVFSKVLMALSSLMDKHLQARHSLWSEEKILKHKVLYQGWLTLCS